MYNNKPHSGNKSFNSSNRPYSSQNRNSTFRTNSPRPFVRRPYVKVENTYGFKKDSMITAPEVVVIDFEGVNKGTMQLANALALAQEQELTLVEVASHTKPPVCRIVNWEKFRYEAKLKQEAKKSASKNRTRVHTAWFSALGQGGDYEPKLKRIVEWTEDGHQVNIEVRLKGGRYTTDYLVRMMDKVLTDLNGKVKMVDKPKFNGNRKYSVSVFPLK